MNRDILAWLLLPITLPIGIYLIWRHYLPWANCDMPKAFEEQRRKHLRLVKNDKDAA